VATWYRPPGSCLDLFVDYENFIEKCDYENKQLIISGDMNCDYSKINSEAHTKKLQLISSTYPLEQ
jgi:exonuclease III